MRRSRYPVRRSRCSISRQEANLPFVCEAQERTLKLDIGTGFASAGLQLDRRCNRGANLALERGAGRTAPGFPACKRVIAADPVTGRGGYVRPGLPWQRLWSRRGAFALPWSGGAQGSAPALYHSSKEASPRSPVMRLKPWPQGRTIKSLSCRAREGVRSTGSATQGNDHATEATDFWSRFHGNFDDQVRVSEPARRIAEGNHHGIP